MRFEVSADIPAPVEEVFDFLDDPASALALNEHAAAHVVHSEVVKVTPDGRRTIDLQMQAGMRVWMQTIEQVERHRPTRLVTRGWTWTVSREDPLVVITMDRRLAATPRGTRLSVAADYQLLRASLAARIRARLQAGAVRLEFVNSIHRLADHFGSDVRRPT